MSRNPAAKVYIFSYKSQSQRRDMYYIGCFGTFFMYWRPSPVHLDYIDTGFVLFYCPDIGMSVILRSWLPGVLRVQKSQSRRSIRTGGIVCAASVRGYSR